MDLVHNPARLKLGKKAAAHDPRTLKMAHYLGHALPPPPVSAGYIKAVSAWPMMRNDELGDCTCASAGHLIQLFTANNGPMATPTDQEIVTAYSAITGYDPSDPDSDQGAVEIEVLKFWRKTGIAGRKIDAFVSVNPTVADQVRQAINLFGASYAGVALPITAQSQDIWHVTGAVNGDAQPGTWGGHAIPIVAYDRDTLTCVTWGVLKKMTWQWFETYCDEAYALLSQDWGGADGIAPNHFNLAQLKSDLAAL